MKVLRLRSSLKLAFVCNHVIGLHFKIFICTHWMASFFVREFCLIYQKVISFYHFCTSIFSPSFLFIHTIINCRKKMSDYDEIQYTVAFKLQHLVQFHKPGKPFKNGQFNDLVVKFCFFNFNRNLHDHEHFKNMKIGSVNFA